MEVGEVKLDEGILSVDLKTTLGENLCLAVARDFNSMMNITSTGTGYNFDRDSENTLAKLAKDLITAIRCNIESVEPNPERTDWKSVVNIQYISEEMEMLEKLIKDNKYNV